MTHSTETVWQPDSGGVNQYQHYIYQGQSVEHNLTSQLIKLLTPSLVFISIQYLETLIETSVPCHHHWSGIRWSVLMLDWIRIILNDDDVLWVTCYLLNQNFIKATIKFWQQSYALLWEDKGGASHQTPGELLTLNTWHWDIMSRPPDSPQV